MANAIEVQDQTEFWKKIWSRDVGDRQRMLGRLHEARQTAVMQPGSRPTFQAQWLRRALEKAKEERAEKRDLRRQRKRQARWLRSVNSRWQTLISRL